MLRLKSQFLYIPRQRRPLELHPKPLITASWRRRRSWETPASQGAPTAALKRSPPCSNHTCRSVHHKFPRVPRRDMADLAPEHLTPDQLEEIREAFKVR